MASKWTSEAVWLSALSVSKGTAETYSKHTYYNKAGVLDEAYTAQMITRERMRFDRIFAAGEPEW